MVGLDTEFVTRGGARRIVSYQFCAPFPADPSLLVEVVILPVGGCARLSLHTALWRVVRAGGLLGHPVAEKKGLGPSFLGIPARDLRGLTGEERAKTVSERSLPVVLACHYGSADLTAFRTGRNMLDHLARLTSAAGGLVTLLPFPLRGWSADRNYLLPLSITVRDTMAHAPAGKKSLEALGAACGVPKLGVPEDLIERMDDYLVSSPDEFLNYAMNDARIVVEFLARLWGDSVLPPVTLSGGAASALVDSGLAYWGLSRPSQFREAFAGLLQQDQGLDVVDEDDALTFYARRGRAPLDGAASTFMDHAARAYHGGLNACPMPGYWPGPTVDVDAQNAYPTAMASIVDVDWERGVIDEVVKERELTLDDVPSPATPFVGFVAFEFPEEVPFPCVPVFADGTLIYPRTSEGLAGTYVAAPEAWLALRLGARVWCQIGYTGHVLIRDGEPSRVLRHGVRQLIEDRRAAKCAFGGKSLEELTLKTAVNSVYGKTAQDVSEQRAWDAFRQQMDAVGGSAVTSPYHAAMTTSMVRAQLHAAANQLESLGFAFYSMTTDGFITDAPVPVVEDLDLYGLAEMLRESRETLTGDRAVWEGKHAQDDLVNFTTRGNVSLSPDGVCAHNGLKVPDGIEEDSLEDRERLLRLVVTRTGKIANPYTRFPSFKELSRRDKRRDFVPHVVSRSLSMDFDLKCAPLLDQMVPAMVPLPDGTEHEMATFPTRAWETVEEASRARRLAREWQKKNRCLRTVDQWRAWHLKLVHGAGRHIDDPDRARLMSFLIAARTGVIDVPLLRGRSLRKSDKLDLLNRLGLGSVSEADWDNARRPERMSRMLPLDDIQDVVNDFAVLAKDVHGG